jgi:hypothetical protein
MPGSLALFGEPVSDPPPPVPHSPAVNERPVWSRYNPKNRLPCDHCKQAQADGTMTTIARLARWRRKVGNTDLLLCAEHAEPLQKQDAVPPSMRKAAGAGR